MAVRLSSTPHVAEVAVLLLGFYVIYRVFTSVALWRRRQAIRRVKGTADVPSFPERPSLKQRAYGLDLFIANIKALKAHEILDVTKQRFQSSGLNTIQMYTLGRRVTSTIEPENLKTIQAVEFKKWSLGSRRKVAFLPLLGEGIFTTDGAAWSHSREMLRPNFARSSISDVETFEKHVSHLVAAIPRDGRTVDLSELFFRLTIDSATEFLFGESVETLVKGSGAGFADAFTQSQESIAHHARWGSWARFFPANKQFSKDAKTVHDFVDYFVDKGLAQRGALLSEKPDTGSTGRYIFIDELVRQTTDRIRIRSELLNILLAGRDTTASLLTNVWFTLSKRPDIWAKLQAEVAQLDGEKPSFEKLKELKYLRSLMNESLRMYPVVPVNSREAQEDTTLPLGGGPDGRAPIFIPKGGVVSWSVHAMHRRKDYYGEDAEEFRPERWLDDPATGKKGLRPGWEYLPFNGGARICLGQQFALTEASYTTVRLCQAFSAIESRDPEQWKEFITLTCVSLNGAKVALTARE